MPTSVSIVSLSTSFSCFGGEQRGGAQKTDLDVYESPKTSKRKNSISILSTEDLRRNALRRASYYLDHVLNQSEISAAALELEIEHAEKDKDDYLRFMEQKLSDMQRWLEANTSYVSGRQLKISEVRANYVQIIFQLKEKLEIVKLCEERKMLLATPIRPLRKRLSKFR